MQDASNPSERSPVRPAARLLTIPQAAEQLSISTRQVYRLHAMGELRFVKLGRLVRVPVDSLDKLITRGGVR